jgi:hypothetical protein
VTDEPPKPITRLADLGDPDRPRGPNPLGVWALCVVVGAWLVVFATSPFTDFLSRTPVRFLLPVLVTALGIGGIVLAIVALRRARRFHLDRNCALAALLVGALPVILTILALPIAMALSGGFGD